MDRIEYYKLHGWEKSPFIKTSSPTTPIVERTQEYKKLEESIGGWDRILLITAPIGYGKTTFMNQIRKTPPQTIQKAVSFNTHQDVEDVIDRIRKTFPIYTRILESRPKSGVFGEYLTKKLGSSRMLLIFDEAQDYPPKLLKWLRMLNDRCENLFMLFIGLPGLEDRIAGETSLRDRKSKTLSLSPLEPKQLRRMLLQRIEWAGGGDTPFTENAIDYLCKTCENVPRRLLENAQKTVEYCAKNEIMTITEQNVETALGTVKPVKKPEKSIIDEVGQDTGEKTDLIMDYHADFSKHLSPTQKDIVELLQRHESLCIAEISEKLGKDVRSIGSLVRKLRGLNPQEVARKPEIPYPVVVKQGKEPRQGRLQTVFGLSDNARRSLDSA